MFVGVP